MILNNTKIVIISCVIILLLSSIVFGTDSNYKSGSEPDGFRGQLRRS